MEGFALVQPPTVFHLTVGRGFLLSHSEDLGRCWSVFMAAFMAVWCYLTECTWLNAFLHSDHPCKCLKAHCFDAQIDPCGTWALKIHVFMLCTCQSWFKYASVHCRKAPTSGYMCFIWQLQTRIKCSLFWKCHLDNSLISNFIKLNNCLEFPRSRSAQHLEYHRTNTEPPSVQPRHAAVMLYWWI